MSILRATYIRSRYIFALVLIAVLAVSAFTVLKITISQQDTLATAINISGRQRMLSQRTAMLALEYSAALDAVRREEKRIALEAATALFRHSHTALFKW